MYMFLNPLNPADSSVRGKYSKNTISIKQQSVQGFHVPQIYPYPKLNNSNAAWNHSNPNLGFEVD